MKIPKQKIARFIGILALCQGAGIIGSIFTFDAIKNWYAYLDKPSFSPPNWIFGPVWFVLYTLMAVAFFLILEKKKQKNTKAIVFFLVQLFFNTLWSAIFFGLKNLGFGFVDISLMLIFIIMTIFEFRRINKTAAMLMVPYLAWVSFAALLNYSIWQLNP